MSDITQARKALVARILDGDGRASQAQRRAAFNNAGLSEPVSTLIDKVTKRAYKVTDEDIAAVRAAGLTEDQIFEIVVCAALGQATRQYDTAVAALDAATERIEHASRDEGLVCLHSCGLSPAGTRYRQAGLLPSRFLIHTGEEACSRGDARTLCMVRWRPRADGGLRVKDEPVRVLNEGARRGRGEGV